MSSPDADVETDVPTDEEPSVEAARIARLAELATRLRTVRAAQRRFLVLWAFGSRPTAGTTAAAAMGDRNSGF